MTSAVAFHSAMPRSTPVPIAAARPRSKRPMTPGKENVIQLKSVPAPVGAVSNIRSRRERPCDACRRRKSRCVIHEGAVLCVLCEFHKQECTFVQSPQPRKRKPVGDGKKEPAKKRSVDASPSSQDQNPAEISPVSLTTTSPQQAFAHREIATLGETLGLQRRKHSRYIGRTTPFDPTLISLSEFDIHHESNFDLGTLRRVNENECFIMLPDESTREYAEEADALNALEQAIGSHGPALVDIYFRTVHPSFPIIQKYLFLERYRANQRQFSPALLAGMYILALNWWSHDPSLAVQQKPDAAKLESIASKALAFAIQRPKLSTVQGGLLLLQRPEADSWSLTTQLVAVGQELGLHLDCSNWSIPVWERGLRKRIAWALYMQDKWSSLIHGRPSHIFSANWAVKPITANDFAEDSEVMERASPQSEDDLAEAEAGQTLFSQMIALTGIMAEVMDTFYTQVAIQDFENAGKNSTQLILERAKPVQIKLKEWFAKLPNSMRTQNTEGKKLSSTGYLHLAYFATEITLHRRIVQSLDPKVSEPYLLYICRSAAKTRLISAMDFVNRLKPEHLQSFWYFASKINFTLIGTFGSLLWATAPAQEEAEFYKTRLREYRWTLSVSAKRAQFLDYAVQMLDASRAMLNNLAEKPSIAQSQVSNAGVPSERFAAAAASGTRSPGVSSQAQAEQIGGEDSPELSRYPSGTSFAGFPSTEALEQYADRMEEDSPGTSVSGVRD
ncbi:fungal-specific transcription factor domain-containing protein [Lineolata rhizophorae]|uniref:Fungal-specific transcription factor domain-containing protein n=1 Tax=Lineolata rhizophorae TaxID=578093 RepID=A0A6A6P7L1_9PEZI|nr:fungal-specific transcription factor domain-containing protein [Lineolata rhizophorae]